METPFNQTNIKDSKIMESEFTIDSLVSKLEKDDGFDKSLTFIVSTNTDSWDEWFPWEYF